LKGKATHIPRIYSTKLYTPNDKRSWDAFIGEAKNATFLFRRDFMEYHAPKFSDFSLLVYKAKKLVAVLPANRVEDKVYSHQGLTYGGLVLSKNSKLEEVAAIFIEVLEFLGSEGVKTLNLKLMPTIYHSLLSDELEYLLFLTEAKLVRVDVLSSIDMGNTLKILSNRMEGVKKGRKNDLQITEETEFGPFWNKILIPNLKERHNAQPVHSLQEIEKLAALFPKNIIQFNVYKGDEIVAGATIFETKTVAHAQYISANADKQQLGSLDFLFEFLIKSRYKDKKYFDFGTSNENNGKQVNKGLQYWKESFGARSVVQDFYEVKTANCKKLKGVFI
jgi:hypothetical protein